MERKVPIALPHIRVEVEYNGAKVSQQGTFFIDAVAFLCKAEEAIRNGLDVRDCDQAAQAAIAFNKRQLKKGN